MPENMTYSSDFTEFVLLAWDSAQRQKIQF